VHETSLEPSEEDALRDELLTLTTERDQPGRPDLDTMTTRDLVRQMNDEDATVPHAVALQAEQISSAIDSLVDRLKRGGRLFYLGAGTPGRIGFVDASEIPPTFGTDPDLVVGLIAGGPTAITTAVENAEDDADAAGAELAANGLTEADTVVGVSASGRTPYVVGGLRFARSVGALTVSIASNRNSPIAAVADIPIDVIVGPEFVSGSTRLKSGTAQKLVLNMISTIAMIKLGKTYNGHMVDLRATNAKLQRRSELTVVGATGLDATGARAALEAAEGSVKLAILMTKTNSDRSAARRALEEADGFLRIALAAAAE
jgi:N-acetylmuramic acid 6-phosphate etherase